MNAEKMRRNNARKVPDSIDLIFAHHAWLVVDLQPVVEKQVEWFSGAMSSKHKDFDGVNLSMFDDFAKRRMIVRMEVRRRQ